MDCWGQVVLGCQDPGNCMGRGQALGVAGRAVRGNEKQIGQERERTGFRRAGRTETEDERL